MLDASALLTHLSLSLSLCSQFLSAENGASTDFLAGRCRAFGCGFSHVRRRPLPAAPLSGARVDNNLGRPPHNPWGMSEEVPSRVPSRVGSVVGPMCRGLVPNRGPRHALLVIPACRRLVECHGSLSPTGLWRSRRPRRVLQHAPVVVSAERRGPIDPGRGAPRFVSVSAKQVRTPSRPRDLIPSRPIVPLQRAGREKTSGACAGSACSGAGCPGSPAGRAGPY